MSTLIPTPEGFYLRPATNADSTAVKELIFSVLQSYGLSPDPAGTDSDLADIEGFYGRPMHSLDVLIETGGNRVVGTVGLFPVDATTVELRKMYLSPAMRGRGLGKLLLDHAIGRAREMGFSRMTLETASVLKEAVALYRKAGFKPCAPTHLASRCDMAMELLLTSS